jgi:hypothetical protein
MATSPSIATATEPATANLTAPAITESYLNFIHTIKSPKTRSNYIQALRYYMQFSKKTNYDDLLQDAIANPKDTQRNVIMFIEFLKTLTKYQRNL